MSIAWGSLVLLIILLPGVLFFVGQYFPEQFTRETVERSPLGQLAGTLLVAFLVHGLLCGILQSFCGREFPCIDLAALLLTISPAPGNSRIYQEVADGITANRWWILLYVSLTCAMGLGAGWLTGCLVSSGRLRFLAQHTWIYDLSIGQKDSFTVAYVMTHVKHEERVLLYRGFLKAFGLQQDGRFSYIVLTDAVRYYMHLDPATPRTTDKTAWRLIGETSNRRGSPVPDQQTAGRTRDRSYFVIEGEDIANAVFDRYAGDYDISYSDLLDLLSRQRQRMESRLAGIGESPAGSSATAPVPKPD